MRITVEARAAEFPQSGSQVAVRAVLTPLHVEAEPLLDAGLHESRELIRVVWNRHRRLGGSGETFDLALEGDLAGMEEMARSVLEAARSFRADRKKEGIA